MSVWLEALVVLVPRDAGGRPGFVTPRDGSYRPFLRDASGAHLRVRVIEGPARLAAGESGQVVAELEDGPDTLAPGMELELFELEPRPVGILRIGRIWRTEIGTFLATK